MLPSRPPYDVTSCDKDAVSQASAWHTVLQEGPTQGQYQKVQSNATATDEFFPEVFEAVPTRVKAQIEAIRLTPPEAHRAPGWPSSPCHTSRPLPAPGGARRLQPPTPALGGERTAAGATEPAGRPARCWLAAATALRLRAKKGAPHCCCSHDLSCTGLGGCSESCGAKSFIFSRNKSNATAGPAGIPLHTAKPTAGTCSAACKPLPSAALTLR